MSNIEKSFVYGINGPVVKTRATKNFKMLEMVYVGQQQLLGEVISIDEHFTTIQVYEVTTNLKVGEEIVGTGSLLSVSLGPGLLGNIYDGIQRPLIDMKEQFGSFVTSGSKLNPLPVEKKWDCCFTVQAGDFLKEGSSFGYTWETEKIQHHFLVPISLSGMVKSVVKEGAYTTNDVLIVIEDDDGNLHELRMIQKWPIRQGRKVRNRKEINMPLVTGQRVIDSFFPIAKGGAAAIPGGFGAGKTMLQHQLAKWCDADIIVYIGCGERGNEMTQVLEEFAELMDPRTNRPLTERTVLIANTSNMPVAAREASIYTGITIAEYYRDMGYHVALMADSTSRWAEALREISGRLEEMPAEEGFPAYLPSRISEFYERAGYVNNLAGSEGSVSIIGAVSPQGADFSEPVTQNTKRFVRAFWALDKNLAYSRHFPAVNYTESYSEYLTDLKHWFDKNVDRQFMNLRNTMVRFLSEESRLLEIVKLIGADVLPEDQKLLLEISRVIRVGFLQQDAFHKVDTYVPYQKQFKMMELVLYLYDKCMEVLASKRTLKAIRETNIFDEIVRIKYVVSNDDMEVFESYKKKIDQTLATIV
jgi:Archaeal/vacuolar-type H+-ATPase subunit A